MRYVFGMGAVGVIGVAATLWYLRDSAYSYVPSTKAIRYPPTRRPLASSSFHGIDAIIGSCPRDPWVQPGYVQYPIQVDAINETRWIPFPEHDPLSSKPISTIPKDDNLPATVSDGLPMAFTADLRNWQEGEGGSKWDWARDKMILLVGKCTPFFPDLRSDWALIINRFFVSVDQ